MAEASQHRDETRPADQVLVDTDVVSYLFRGDTRAEAYPPHLPGRRVAVSFMTIAELDRWILQRHWGTARRERLEAFLSHFTVYLVDRALCARSAEVSDAARRAGTPIQTADAWIAATALLHGIPLITHNRRDYAAVPDLLLVSESPMSSESI